METSDILFTALLGGCTLMVLALLLREYGRREPKSTPRQLSVFERQIMKAIENLGDNAYGLMIWREVCDTSEFAPSLGLFYVNLERLEAEGFVENWSGEPTPERGNRAKLYCNLTEAGVQALRAAGQQ